MIPESALCPFYSSSLVLAFPLGLFIFYILTLLSISFDIPLALYNLYPLLSHP